MRSVHVIVLDLLYVNALAKCRLHRPKGALSPATHYVHCDTIVDQPDSIQELYVEHRKLSLSSSHTKHGSSLSSEVSNKGHAVCLQTRSAHRRRVENTQLGNEVKTGRVHGDGAVRLHSEHCWQLGRQCMRALGASAVRPLDAVDERDGGAGRGAGQGAGRGADASNSETSTPMRLSSANDSPESLQTC
jgi:hypothetical protein